MSRPLHVYVSLLSALALVGGAASQATPPTVGDVYLYSATVQGGSSTASALMRYDPASGQGEMVVDTLGMPSAPGQAAYDPSRGGVLFVGKVQDVNQPSFLWLVDGAGSLTNLGLQDVDFTSLAPAPDGKLYGTDVHGANAEGRVRYYGDDGQLHDLLGAAGSQPFRFAPGSQFDFDLLAYHAPTRSLVAVGPSGILPQDCSGGVADGLILRRVALSADGTRAVGPVGCHEVDITPGGATNIPAGLDALPDGDLLLTVRTSSGALPRMLRIDPVSLAESVFATSGPFLGSAAIGGGCHSQVLGKALHLDTLNDELLAYAEGESGVGTDIGATPPTGTPGIAGGVHTLFEITVAPCDGAWNGLGQGLAGSGGHVPVLAGTGCPGSGASVVVHLSGALAGAPAAVFGGFTTGALPFKGGTLHVVPVEVTVLFTTDGVPGEPGQGAAVFPFALPTGPGLSGLGYAMQAAVGDAGAPKGVALSAGLQMVLG